ncbi:hypothetical protein XELAEV_18021755mg [Xenopus laevis]|uniref:EGF-like domain-containing protein n=1 Tax=Xenopus laevis TaxID=8355 RepID=A0A974HN17_XENLA|nr:hypothetical protein XELAEV_18021755mg [Xenopus laevis]
MLFRNHLAPGKIIHIKPYRLKNYKTTWVEIYLGPAATALAEMVSACRAKDISHYLERHFCATVIVSGDLRYHLSPLASRSSDIDECAAKMHYCHSNTVCVNLPGSYRCDCVSGFIRVDDFSCTAAAPGRDKGLSGFSPNVPTTDLPAALVSDSLADPGRRYYLSLIISLLMSMISERGTFPSFCLPDESGTKTTGRKLGISVTLEYKRVPCGDFSIKEPRYRGKGTAASARCRNVKFLPGPKQIKALSLDSQEALNLFSKTNPSYADGFNRSIEQFYFDRRIPEFDDKSSDSIFKVFQFDGGISKYFLLRNSTLDKSDWVLLCFLYYNLRASVPFWNEFFSLIEVASLLNEFLRLLEDASRLNGFFSLIVGVPLLNVFLNLIVRVSFLNEFPNLILGIPLLNEFLSLIVGVPFLNKFLNLILGVLLMNECFSLLVSIPLLNEFLSLIVGVPLLNEFLSLIVDVHLLNEFLSLIVGGPLLNEFLILIVGVPLLNDLLSLLSRYFSSE